MVLLSHYQRQNRRRMPFQDALQSLVAGGKNGRIKKFRNNPMLNTMRDGLNFAGFRFWTASLLPAVVGTTLPFWLGPPGFTFRPIIAIEFLLVAVLFHAGFSFFLAWFERDQTEWWSREIILGSAGLCIGFGCLIGFHINNNLQLLSHVYPGIFLVYGFCTFFVGVIYVVPPVCFFRQAGGEIVVSYSLGMLPIIGAYLIQIGDITRTVYLASLPVIVMTGLWVWIDKLANYQMDQISGRKTLVTYFGIHFSGRVGVPVIILMVFFYPAARSFFSFVKSAGFTNFRTMYTNLENRDQSLEILLDPGSNVGNTKNRCCGSFLNLHHHCNFLNYLLAFNPSTDFVVVGSERKAYCWAFTPALTGSAVQQRKALRKQSLVLDWNKQPAGHKHRQVAPT